MLELMKKTLVHVLALSVLGLGMPLTVRAEMIGTLAGIESAQRTADAARVGRVLAQQQVRDQMQALGVDAVQIESRLAALTDSELNELAERLDTLPAGAGLLEVVGIVFVVLLILEAVGVTDLFKKFP